MQADDESNHRAMNVTGGSLRLFVALETNDDIKQTLAAAQVALRQGDELPMRWATPEQSHCTLVFLGNVPRTVVSPLVASLRPVVAEHRPMTLHTGTVGAFPSVERPRVLWLGITGDLQALAALQRAVANAIGTIAGITIDRKPYQPHLTLGRVPETVRDSVGLSRITSALQRKTEIPSATWPVNDVVLIQSVLEPGGARYTVLERFPLGTKDGSR